MHFSKVTLNTCPNKQSFNLQEVRKLTSPSFKRKKKEKTPNHKNPSPNSKLPLTLSPFCFVQPGRGPKCFQGCAGLILLNLPQGQTLHEWTYMNHSFRLLSHSGLSVCLVTVISIRLSFQHILPLLSPEPAQAFILLFQLLNKASVIE